MNEYRKNYLEILGEKKKNKYGNKRTDREGRSFASKLEAEVFDYLKLLEGEGEFRDIRCQVHVYLTDARIDYIPDFCVFDVKLGQDVYVEAKGFQTETWLLKKKLWRYYGPGRLRIFMMGDRAIKQVEEIVPMTYTK